MAPLERLHCDVLYVRASEVGATSGLGSVQYVSTVMDQGTGVSLVGLLSKKSAVAGHVQQCIELLERQCIGGHKVKSIRFDRGGEYVASELQQWFAQRGIVVEPTAPHSPQQNGRAEKLNRTLLDRTRCVLFGLPLELWPEALVYVNWLRNRLVYAPIGMSPYEALTGEKPDVSKAHVFGSKVVYTVPKQLRNTKLHPTGRAGRFLGFDGGAYKVLPDGVLVRGPGRQQLVLARDVRFLEAAEAAEAEQGATEGEQLSSNVVHGSSGSTAAVGAPPQGQLPAGSGSSSAGTQQQDAGVRQQQGAEASRQEAAAGGGPSGAPGAPRPVGGALSPTRARLPIRRLSAMPEPVGEPSPRAPEVPAAAGAPAPAAGARVSARTHKGKAPVRYDDEYAGVTLAPVAGDEERGGGLSGDTPLSAFVSFR